MNNQIFLVGRIVSDINDETKNITIATQRNYKNADGIYDADFIDIVVNDNIAKNISEYCKKGDLVGIKGRIQTDFYIDENHEKKKNIFVISEKISFLSCSKEQEQSTNEIESETDEIEYE